MFGAFGFGQGYFGQGPLGGSPPGAVVAIILALDLIATAGLPVESYAAALAVLECSASYLATLDIDASRG